MLETACSMAVIPDLQPCFYLPIPTPERLLAVGWLGRHQEFRKGPVEDSAYRKLQALAVNLWQPFATAGRHECDLCQYEGARFSGNIFVPFDGVIYVAPAGILHYIATHWYQPPPIFMLAVRECPAMNSTDYKKAILANGGRLLVGPGEA